MNSQNFSLKTVKNLSETASQQDLKNYVTKYFVPLSNGKHALLNNNIYEIFEKKVIKETYFDRMDKKVSDYYFKENLDVKTITYKLNKPTFYDEYLNLCPKMKHEYLPYKDFSDEIKGKVNIVLKFIKDIWCSGNKDSYIFCEKWLSNMIKGNKNNSCLYLKCHFQGMGKSTLPIFIRDHVIGDKLCLETGSEPIKSKFNSILAGKLMVVLEELENFSIGEWQSVSTCLKRIITSKTINIQSKGVDAYETENLNNYILISNNDAIKDDDGRRYFVLDLSTEFLGREDYFDNIYNNCFNDEVGKAFFCYMMEINTDGFNPQKYPITQNKRDSIAKALDSSYQFLKNKYVLYKKGIDSVTVEHLYEAYKDYCQHETLRPLGKINFGKKLKDIGIHFKQSSGARENRYKVDVKTLLDIATKHKWIHELDCWKDENRGDVKDNEDNENNILKVVNIDYKTKYDNLLIQFEELKKSLEVKITFPMDMLIATRVEVLPEKKKVIVIYDSDEEEEQEFEQDFANEPVFDNERIYVCCKCHGEFNYELNSQYCKKCYETELKDIKDEQDANDSDEENDEEIKGASLCFCCKCFGEFDYELRSQYCNKCYETELKDIKDVLNLVFDEQDENDSDIEDELDEENEKQLDKLADQLLED